MKLFGDNEPRVIKHAGKSSWSENSRPTMHGMKGGWTLLSGTGAAIRWGGGDDVRVRVTGEKPGGGRQR